MKKIYFPKGETLIEALGAMAIIVIVITAVASSMITSLSNSKSNENATLATKFAQQGIEQVRQIRNKDYAAFTGYEGKYCLEKDQTTLGSVQSACLTPNVDHFIRSVDINQNPGCSKDAAKVTVTVSYKDGKCASGTYCHNQTFNTCLSTVNPVSAL